MNVYRVPIANDGTEHPDWQTDGPVSGKVTVAAADAEEAKATVRGYWKAEHGWEVGEPERVAP